MARIPLAAFLPLFTLAVAVTSSPAQISGQVAEKCTLPESCGDETSLLQSKVVGDASEAEAEDEEGPRRKRRLPGSKRSRHVRKKEKAKARRKSVGSWSQLQIVSPPERHYHTMVVDDGSNIYLFGGRASDPANMDNVPLNDVWLLNLAGPTWKQLDDGKGNNKPAPRERHSAVWKGDGFMIFGGDPDLDDSDNLLNDVWEYNIGSNSWTEKIANGETGSPPPRMSHSAVWRTDTQTMLVHGGGVDGGSVSDLWEYTYSSNSWAQLETAPSPRWVHTAVWAAAENTMIVFGGVSGLDMAEPALTSYQDSTGVDAWNELSPIPPLKAKWGHVAAWNPTEESMVMFGGLTSLGGQTLKSDLWAYSLKSGWTRLYSRTDAPPGVLYAAGVWVDSEQAFVVFGGLVEEDSPAGGYAWTWTPAEPPRRR